MCSDVSKGSPKDTMAFLVALDPAFEAELDADDLDGLSHHRVMMAFASHFGARHGSYSPKQLAQLGNWLNAGVAAGGELENAISTCFLEHARQLKVNRVLAPYLSPLAKRSTHA